MEGEEFEGAFAEKKTANRKPVPAAPVKKTGWGLELTGKKTKKKKGKEESLSAEYDKEELETYIESQPVEVKNISSLTDMEREELIKTVADAPSFQDGNIQSLSELQGEEYDIETLLKAEKGIDLGILVDSLVSSEQACEKDVEWNEKTLLEVLSSN